MVLGLAVVFSLLQSQFSNVAAIVLDAEFVLLALPMLVGRTENRILGDVNVCEGCLEKMSNIARVRSHRHCIPRKQTPFETGQTEQRGL